MIIEFKTIKRKVKWDYPFKMAVYVNIWSSCYLHYKHPILETLWKKYYHSHIYNEEFIIDDRNFIFNISREHSIERITKSG